MPRSLKRTMKDLFKTANQVLFIKVSVERGSDDLAEDVEGDVSGQTGNRP